MRFGVVLAQLYGRPVEPLPPGAPEMRRRLTHLSKFLVGTAVVPCCRSLALEFVDLDNPGTVLTRPLVGSLFLRLHEHSGMPGDDVMLAHHDTQLRGKFNVYPRGAWMRGCDVRRTFVQFKPRKIPEDPEAGSRPGYDERVYAFHVDGILENQQFTSTTFLRFQHVSCTRDCAHLAAEPPVPFPGFAYSYRFCGKRREFLGIEDVMIPEQKDRAAVWFRESLRRHHTFGRGSGMRLRSGRRLLEERFHSRRAFLRDLESRLTRTLP